MERKEYHIPRRVDEGFKFLGLKGRDFIIVIPVVLLALVIVLFTGLPIKAKVVIAVFLVVPTYMGMSFELSNGLLTKDYIKLLLRFYLIDQNDYSLTSSASRISPHPKVDYVKPEAKSKEAFIVEAETSPMEPEDDKEAALERLRPWIAQPKRIQ
ncbi:hypothetical protein [Paenibacillus pasadenensis]|uniref:hypothetical protein n=1 Tax=Paenibacillus pasadenensis TaxID=217090 RepID=UPI000C7B661C|nr:hypothetical protein [Paenibacillus pasadenensis]